MNANVQLKPPYNILIDTNFVKFAQQERLEIEREAMTALCGTVKLFVTDCVFAELELLKEKAKLALEYLFLPLIELNAMKSLKIFISVLGDRHTAGLNSEFS